MNNANIFIFFAFLFAQYVNVCYICIIQKTNDMYSIEIYNHETKTQTQKFSFDNKREANKFVNKNAEKRGFDFFCKSDRSLEYQKLY